MCQPSCLSLRLPTLKAGQPYCASRKTPRYRIAWRRRGIPRFASVNGLNIVGRARNNFAASERIMLSSSCNARVIGRSRRRNSPRVTLRPRTGAPMNFAAVEFLTKRRRWTEQHANAGPHQLAQRRQRVGLDTDVQMQMFSLTPLLHYRAKETGDQDRSVANARCRQRFGGLEWPIRRGRPATGFRQTAV